MPIAKAITCFLLLTLFVGIMAVGGCAKEYSCEGCLMSNGLPVADTTGIIKDTIPVDSSFYFKPCSACDSTKPLALNTWSLRNYHSYLCGIVNYSFFDPGKISFGLGGNPACTTDTGFILNAYFSPLSFTTDRFHISTTNQSFMLQDRKASINNGAEYIFRTDGTTPPNSLTIVVDTFLNASRLMVGRFYGYAYTKENRRSYIDGRFRLSIQ